MKEGTQSLSPLTAPARRDMLYIPFSGVIAFGGSQAAGGKTPIERFEFFQKHFYKAKN